MATSQSNYQLEFRIDHPVPCHASDHTEYYVHSNSSAKGYAIIAYVDPTC